MRQRRLRRPRVLLDARDQMTGNRKRAGGTTSVPRLGIRRTPCLVPLGRDSPIWQVFVLCHSVVVGLRDTPRSSLGSPVGVCTAGSAVRPCCCNRACREGQG